MGGGSGKVRCGIRIGRVCGTHLASQHTSTDGGGVWGARTMFTPERHPTPNSCGPMNFPKDLSHEAPGRLARVWPTVRSRLWLGVGG